MEKSKFLTLPEFKICIFFDTNILSYLIDRTFSSLNAFVLLLSKIDFIELYVSKFVLFELIGIRKKEHYLRGILKSSPKNADGTVNLTSLLKYHNRFTDIPNCKSYYEQRASIENKIKRELNSLKNKFKLIPLEDLNNNLWDFHTKLNLSTKLSKEDALVITSIFGENVDIGKNHNILTNDQELFEFYQKESKVQKIIDKIFKENKIARPILHLIRDIKQNNLESKIELKELNNMTINFISQIIIQQNQNIYLGKTFTSGCSNKEEIFCFLIENSAKVNITNQEGIYITIIDRNLKYQFNLPIKIKEIRDEKGQTITFPCELNTGCKYSIKISNVELADKMKLESSESLKKLKQLREKGNMIFINPESV